MARRASNRLPESRLQELQSGDLAVATYSTSPKYHIITLWESRDEREPNKPKDRSLWDGYALCGARFRKYYFRIVRTPGDAEDGDHCKGCMSKWRGRGKPDIPGWTSPLPSDSDGDEEYPLPFGWKQLPPVGHPWDVAPGDDPAKVTNKAGEIVGRVRSEIMRWQRGRRIVRLVRKGDADSTVYQVRSHWEGLELQESREHTGRLDECRREAHHAMAKGGST